MVKEKFDGTKLLYEKIMKELTTPQEANNNAPYSKEEIKKHKELIKDITFVAMKIMIDDISKIRNPLAVKKYLKNELEGLK